MSKTGKDKYVVPQVRELLGDIALRLKLSRLRRKLTQGELAKMCDLSRDTIAKAESEPAGISLENLLTIIYMLNRLDEVREILSPLEDVHASAIESEEMLSSGRVSKKGRRAKKASAGSFDWEALKGVGIMDSPLESQSKQAPHCKFPKGEMT